MRRQLFAIGGFLGRPRVLLIWAVLVLALWSYWWALSLSRRPAVGTITKPAEQGETVADTVKTLQKYTGKDVEFELAADYRLSRADDPKQPGEIMLYVSEHSRPSRQLAVEVVAGRDLTSEPSYRLRKDNPNQYQERVSQYNGEAVVVFVKRASTFESVAFWRHKDKLATVALSAPNGGDPSNLAAEFDRLMASWVWKETQ